MSTPIEISHAPVMSRRTFLSAGVTAGAMILTVGLPAHGLDTKKQSASQQLNAFVAIEPTGSVQVITPFVEMGQGVHTALPMLVAEELDVPLEHVALREAPLGPEYRLHSGGAARYTGSSLTVKNSFIPLRRAGATARTMLLQAAADEWRVPLNELTTYAGKISHKPSARTASYGDFVAAATQLTPPKDVQLKKSEDFVLIGQPTSRIDMVEKTDGSAIFGIDTTFPNLLVAAVKQSPVFGGTITKLDKKSALAMPGVVAVEAIPNGTKSLSEYVTSSASHVPDDPIGTVAVVADSYWRASSALAKVKVEYSGGEENFSDQQFSKQLRSRIGERGAAAESAGDVTTALADAETRIDAVYEVPLLAHAAMEPINCTALVENNRCTLWTAHQNADWVAMIAAKILAIPIDHVSVVTPYLGGSFGRRNNNDYVIQAVSLAKKFPGRPVKVIWSREEDVQHDYYRPHVVASFQAGFDKDNNPIAFRQVNIGDGALRQSGMMGNNPYDKSLMDSSVKQPYDIANKSTEHVLEKNPIPVGFWRSVGGAHNGFFIESFVDEMAQAVSEDPIAFRQRLLKKSPRFAAVLKQVSDMASWRSEPWQAKDGRLHAMGVALHEDHSSIVGQIVEVSLTDQGTPQVHKVWCAVDCGIVVNPTSATMQVEGAIVYGLSAALMEKIEVRNGRVTNNNFHDYPVLTAQQMPEVEVNFIDSDAAPTGLGEPATPPIPAALCNALFTLTGKRIRTLPVGRLQA